MIFYNSEKITKTQLINGAYFIANSLLSLQQLHLDAGKYNLHKA